MTIIFRDDLGYIAVKVDTNYGISFLEGIAYFTGTSGRDYKISANDISEIQYN